MLTTLRLEILNTGSELLLGNVQDRHLRWFAREFFALGIRIARQTIVPDDRTIRDAMIESFPRTDVLILTGGLGPTSDDMTRELLAEFMGKRLIEHPETLDRILKRCHKKGLSFHPRMQRQAMIPEGAIVLPNDHGSAPGLYLPAIATIYRSTPHIFLLPGPPCEMQPIAISHLFPKLQEITKQFPIVRNECRIYRIVGMHESLVESILGRYLSHRHDLEIGYCARTHEVDLRLIGSQEVLEAIEPLIFASFGKHLLSRGESVQEIIRLLKEGRSTLAIAESCTGGLLASKITDIPGASSVFLQGLVTYSDEAKITLLGVPPDLITQHGSVSQVVVHAMAEGILAKSGATYSLAITGLAGPSGGTHDKPLGTVWIGLSGKNICTQSWMQIIATDRITFKQTAVQLALDKLLITLQGSSASSQVDHSCNSLFPKS